MSYYEEGRIDALPRVLHFNTRRARRQQGVQNGLQEIMDKLGKMGGKDSPDDP
jgi:hypothetical protein